MNFYILVTGSREEFSSQRIINGFDSALRTMGYRPGNHIIVIHGKAPGADRTADIQARRAGWDVLDYPADWKTHKEAAGGIRNTQMVEVAKELHLDPENRVCCVAFLLPSSVGTWDCIYKAEKAGLRVIMEPPVAHPNKQLELTWN